MDKKNIISDPKKLSAYVDFYTTLAMNSLSFLIEYQEPFSIVIMDKERKYAKYFPENHYSNDTITLDFVGWSLEIASIDNELPFFYSTIALGSDNQIQEVPIAINALDIAGIFLHKMPNMPLLSRFFLISSIDKIQENEKPKIIDTTEFEKLNQSGIQHSMSKLTLLTKEETQS